MIQVVIQGKENGQRVLMLGLSFANLAQLKAKPLDTFIRVYGNQTGLPFDVVVFSSESETATMDMLKEVLDLDKGGDSEPEPG